MEGREHYFNVVKYVASSLFIIDTPLVFLWKGCVMAVKGPVGGMVGCSATKLTYDIFFFALSSDFFGGFRFIYRPRAFFIGLNFLCIFQKFKRCVGFVSCLAVQRVGTRMACERKSKEHHHYFPKRHHDDHHLHLDCRVRSSGRSFFFFLRKTAKLEKREKCCVAWIKAGNGQSHFQRIKLAWRSTLIFCGFSSSDKILFPFAFYLFKVSLFIRFCAPPSKNSTG